MTTSSIARPSKVYPNWDFWFENKPSGNTALGMFVAVGRKQGIGIDLKYILSKVRFRTRPNDLL
jgi:hypothetical protein